MNAGWVSVAGVVTAAAVLLGGPPSRRLRSAAPGRPDRGATEPTGASGTGAGIPPGRLTASDVATLATVLAAVLRAGLPAGRAWAVLAERDGPCRELCGVVARMQAAGGTALEGLRLAAERPAGSGSSRRLRVPGRRRLRPERVAAARQLRRLGVCVDVAERTGAPLADVLDGFAAGVRADAAADAEVELALEAPRATAGVLSFLPVAAIGLGALLGADPVSTLVLTAPGRVCLVAGVALWALARLWMRRLVARAAGLR